VGVLALEALPRSLVEVLEREAERRGSTAEALTVQLLLQIASDEEKPGLLLDAARALHEHALKLIERGDYGGACRKLWSSILLALDAYAVAAGAQTPRGFKDYVRLCEEASGEDMVFMDSLYAGIAALVFWKENIAAPRHCHRIAELAEKLDGKVAEYVSSKSQ
jgi:hypothetical protein